MQLQEERLVASEPRGGDRVTVQRNEHAFGDLEGTQRRCGGRKKIPVPSDALSLGVCPLLAPQQRQAR